MLRVVWICNFSNSDIQDRLNTQKKIDEFAPWISLGIEEAKKHQEIELHVISPHRWMFGIKEFKDDNIFYHFFNPGVPFYGRHWPSFFRFDIWTNYFVNRLRIRKIVKKIKPDILHLHGIENAYYSSSILDLHKTYPTLATIQGFISLNYSEGKISRDIISRVKIEKDIMENVNFFGVRDEPMKEIILNHNPSAKLFWHEYFMNIPKRESVRDKVGDYKYDLAFFSRVTKSKGIEDLIKVTEIIRKIKPNIRVAVMGSCNPAYLYFLKNDAKNRGCLENISFLGFQKTQKDIYNILDLSKISILPTYNDNVPGLVIESMLRYIPVVSYKTGGIPEINKEVQNIELVNQGDINELASRVIFLLENPAYAKEIAYKAYIYASNRWNNVKAFDDILTAYKTILNI